MQSPEINEIAKALAAAQAEIKNPVKNKTAKAGTFSYRYADIADVLDAVLPALSKHGIAVSQPTVLDGEILLIETRLLHSSGQWFSSSYPVCRIHGDHQKMGAALTYSRRYALTSIVGVAAEEDTDGNGAAEAEPPKRKPAAAASPKPPPQEPETISEGIDTKAEYVRWCHDQIEGIASVKELRRWWDDEVPQRARFRFSPADTEEMKQRCAARRRELDPPVGAE